MDNASKQNTPECGPLKCRNFVPKLVSSRTLPCLIRPSLHLLDSLPLETKQSIALRRDLPTLVNMREERTSRCGWEVLTSSRRQGSNSSHSPDSGTDLFSSPNTKERSGRGVTCCSRQTKQKYVISTHVWLFPHSHMCGKNQTCVGITILC